MKKNEEFATAKDAIKVQTMIDSDQFLRADEGVHSKKPNASFEVEETEAETTQERSNNTLNVLEPTEDMSEDDSDIDSIAESEHNTTSSSEGIRQVQPEENSNDTIIGENGKRKRNEIEEPPAEKRLAVQGVEDQIIPVKVVHPPNTQEKIKLRRGDSIEFENDGTVIRATVLNREKASGKYYNYFNVNCEDGVTRNIDGERVKFRKVEEEECNMVMIPRERHSDQDCKEAKQVELKKLQEFDTYEVVEDEGQHRISCRWVLWYKSDEVRARLTARGFEELEKVASDSPTIDKCNVRIVLAICASENWILETSDVKSAFLQGDILDRDVIIKPPQEAEVPRGKLWKLKVALYGLNDASLQFFIKCRKVLLELGCYQSTMDPALFFNNDNHGNESDDNDDDVMMMM